MAWQARKKRKVTGETAIVLPSSAGLSISVTEITGADNTMILEVSLLGISNKQRYKPAIIRVSVTMLSI